MSSLILFPTDEFTQTSKSPQQIKKLLLTEGESTSSRILHILTKGHTVQYYYAFKNFPSCYSETLSNICIAAPNAQADNQIAIVQSFEQLLGSCLGEDTQSNTSLFNQHFLFKVRPILTSNQLQLIFNMLIQCLNNWSCSLLNQRILILLEKVLRLSLELNTDPQSSNNPNLLKKLEKTVLQLGRSNQHILLRANAGRLISILPRYLNGTIKGEMVDILKRIHSDSEIQAKRIWVTQIFPRMLNGSQLQFIELHLQQKIYQSIYDENQQIGVLALQSIFKNCNKFSIQEQSSRIVKLFIDSLTSKSQKVCLMVTSIMGQVYQKLKNIIMRVQAKVIKFWKSILQLLNSKDQRIFQNVIYNLPGILSITYRLYDLSPFADVYVDLYYQTTNPLLLVSFLHQMVNIFTSKSQIFKNLIYSIFAEINEDLDDAAEESFQIIDIIIQKLPQIKSIFFYTETCQQMALSISNKSSTYVSTAKQTKIPQQQQKIITIELRLCNYLQNYLSLLINRKNTNSIKIYLQTLTQLYQYFPSDFCENHLLPKLYSSVRVKTSHLPIIIKIIVGILSKEMSNNILINYYISKINVELSKSVKSFERQAALLFFHQASLFFSLQTFQEYKLGEKFLNMHNDRNFKNKATFIRFLPRLNYFFTRQEKIQNSIIISQLFKNSEPEILKILQKTQFTEKPNIRQQIMNASKELKEKEKQKITINGRRASIMKNQSKEVKKQDVKKKTDTKIVAKLAIKQVSKRKLGSNITKLQKPPLGNIKKNS